MSVRYGDHPIDSSDFAAASPCLLVFSGMLSQLGPQPLADVLRPETVTCDLLRNKFLSSSGFRIAATGRFHIRCRVQSSCSLRRL